MVAERKQFDPACPAYADLLVDLSDGELSPAEKQRVQQHVGHCRACRAQLHQLNASLRHLRSSFQEPSLVPLARRQTAPLAWMAAAAACLALALGLGFGRWHTGSSAPGKLAKASSLESPAELMSPSDALRQIALFEQQARLQTSLDLLPSDGYADERAQTKAIVELLRRAAIGSGDTL